MNTMPPSIINGNNNNSNNMADSGKASSFKSSQTDEGDFLSERFAGSLNLGSAPGQNSNFLWNSNLSTATSSQVNMVPGSASLGEDLLELHRKQIMQNTSNLKYGNDYGGAGVATSYQIPNTIIRGSTTGSYVGPTGPGSGSSSQESDPSVNVNHHSSNAQGQSTFANSRWNNLSSPALNNYGQYVNMEQQNLNSGGGYDLNESFHQHQTTSQHQNVFLQPTAGSSKPGPLNPPPHQATTLHPPISGSNIMWNTSNHGTSPNHANTEVNQTIYTTLNTNGSSVLQPSNATQQNLFYMAVPVNNASPSHHAAPVLQPVQMMQLPNGQQTFVIAHSAPQGMSVSQSMPNLQIHSYAPQMMHTYLPQQQNVGGNGGRKGKDHNGRRGNNNMRSRPSKENLYGIDEPSPAAFDPTMNGNSNSPPSEAIAALYQSTRRPALSELLGHVRRLSRDQVGCRLLQQALDEDGPEAATAILNEGLPFLAEAMTDPFGNYLFQKILEKVNEEERLKLITTVSPRLVNAALNLHGTRSVQKVVEVAATHEEAAQIVTRALTPAVARLCIDSHGNHVVQRVLQRLPVDPHAKFVFDAVANAVGDVARHRHGCCVIQRCLDSAQSEARSNLVQRIVEKALDLMQDAYGNYVVQYVLDVCGEDEAAAVCDSVVGKVSLLAVQKFSSNVMEKCLERSGDRVQEMYLQEMSHPNNIRQLMCDPYGNYVVQRGLSVATHAQAVRLVEAMRPHLPGMRNTAGGRRIVAKISRRFPNFTLDVGNNKNSSHNVPNNNMNHATLSYVQNNNNVGRSMASNGGGYVGVNIQDMMNKSAHGNESEVTPHRSNVSLMNMSNHSQVSTGENFNKHWSVSEYM